ncbi:nucleotide exchange factor GrpE [Psychroserpens sp. Hel_I_66]|uniref:nucleotide exchange factor GrpE n=1 Tax=Psychroserpens sp. Hel_I_66 TaxID=1250004 RepID=UPI000648BF39|nr:nucleotide exchange factor GrpE [Psychroserpens sp. Hel_I_66]
MSKKDKDQTIEDSQFQDNENEMIDDSQTEELSIEDKLKEDLAKEKDKFMRLFAEFENYKKRTTKERIDFFKTASEDVMLSMLPVLDDFERALLHIEDDKEAEELRKGVLLIYNKLLSTLEKKGLSKIEVEQGDTFNADDHEAITQIPAPSDDLKGKIIDVVEKGYRLGEKVIRFPKVVIGQ